MKSRSLLMAICCVNMTPCGSRNAKKKVGDEHVEEEFDTYYLEFVIFVPPYHFERMYKDTRNEYESRFRYIDYENECCCTHDHYHTEIF